MTNLSDDERRIVEWLEDRALNDALDMPEPFAKGLLWAVFHPCQFAAERARFFTLVNSAKAIESGQHRKEQ